MKVFCILAGLAALIGLPPVCEADEAAEQYSYFVSLPGNASSYDDWLASSKEAATACGESASTSIGTGRIVVNSDASSLESRVCTRSISASTSLKSTEFGFSVILR